jgi:hypothetical protein
MPESGFEPAIDRLRAEYTRHRTRGQTDCLRLFSDVFNYLDCTDWLVSDKYIEEYVGGSGRGLI